MKDPDLRRARRYGLPLPVTIHSPLEDMTSSQKGRITDISTHGIYFVVEENPGLGTRLKLTLILPSEITGASEVFIHFTAKVLRVETRTECVAGKFGVAASIERYEMIRNNRKI
jgi:hypothetical protein